MKLKFPSYKPWLDECRRIVTAESDYDDIHLVTGEEGRGKSRVMRRLALTLDPTFTVDRIHFSQDPFLDQVAELPPESSIMLDEFRGHKRLAMHGDRLEFLDFLKECRGQRLHIFIGFPHVTQFEGDIVYQRIRWWDYLPVRGVLDVHERLGRQYVGKDGKPAVEVRFPHVGHLPFPDQTPDPHGAAYYEKKKARMRDRAARYRENHRGKDLPASRLSLPDLDEAFAALPAPRRAGDTGSTRYPPGLLDDVARDIKKAMQ